MKSIQARFVLMVVSMLFLSILLITLPVVMNEISMINANLEKQSAMTIDRGSLEISNYIAMPSTVVQNTSSFMATQKFDKVSAETFLVSELHDHPEFTELYMAEAKGFKYGGYFYSNDHWTPPADYDQTQRPWYIAAEKTDGLAFSPPYVDANTKALVVTIATIVKDKNGTRGVVGLDMNLKALTDIVAAKQVSRSGMSYLLDSEGKYITNSDTEKLMKVNFFTEQKLEGFKDRITADSAFFTAAVGDNRYFAARVISPETGWVLVTVGPLSEVYGDLHRSILLILSILFVSLALFIGLTVFVTRKLVSPIVEISGMFRSVAEGEGDLTNRIHVQGKDEVALLSRHFNTFQDNLSGLVLRIRQFMAELSQVGETLSSSATETAAALNQITSNIVSVRSEIGREFEAVNNTKTAVDQVGATINELNSRMDVQVKSIDQSSAAIEEMAANIQAVTETTSEMDRAYRLLVEAAEAGRVMLNDVNARVNTVIKSSEDLQNTNTLIENIASQTNLLAMNAAIEAAHAGESGKGFAVVADEIRKLAESSSSQAKSTRDMLKQIIEAISIANLASQNAEKAFADIMGRIERLTTLESQIDAAMKEQSVGSNQILESLGAIHSTTDAVRESSRHIHDLTKSIVMEVGHLNQISTQIHDSMEEISSGTQEINKAVTIISDKSLQNRDIIGKVQAEVDRFKINEKGSSTTA